jgi:hypothetical protein
VSRRLLAAAVFMGVALHASAAEAVVRRYALVVGSNEGDASEVKLRYAESDAQRVGRVLREHGDFPPENVLVLVDGEADDVRRALIGMNSRVRDDGGDSVLFVFYSGHADADTLHVRGTRLDVKELRDLVYGSPAGARVLVVDACRSGAVTRAKGGTVAASFVIDVDAPLTASGIAILSSSAAGEDSQESEALEASFFTHYLVSALLGAGDGDGDGRVSLAEAFSYSSERTLIATSATVSGPQHPTYRFELGGQGDLVLTEPGRLAQRFGALQFASAGTWLVQRGGKEGGVAGEITTGEGGQTRRLSLPGGSYHVTLRTPRKVLEGGFQVAAGAATTVDPAVMREVSLARLVRKGAYGRGTVWQPFLMAGVRGDVHNLGRGFRGEGGVRLDLQNVSLEMRVGGGRSVGEISGTLVNGETITRPVEARERSLTFGASRVFDLRRVSLGAGGEAGALLLERRVVPEFASVEDRYPVQSDVGFVTGPVGHAEMRVWRRLVVRTDVAWLLYVADPIDLPRRQENPQWQTTYRIGFGMGMQF